jgi:hypothetical protein
MGGVKEECPWLRLGAFLWDYQALRKVKIRWKG